MKYVCQYVRFTTHTGNQRTRTPPRYSVKCVGVQVQAIVTHTALPSPDPYRREYGVCVETASGSLFSCMQVTFLRLFDVCVRVCVCVCGCVCGGVCVGVFGVGVLGTCVYDLCCRC